MTSLSALKRRLESLGLSEGLGSYSLHRMLMIDYEIRSLWIDDGSQFGKFLRFLKHGEMLLDVEQPKWVEERDEVTVLRKDRELWDFNLGKHLSERDIYGPFLEDPEKKAMVGKMDCLTTLLDAKFMRPQKGKKALCARSSI